jgi:hypothetical protein
MPWPLYRPGKSPRYKLRRRLGGARSQSGCCGEEKNLALAGNRIPAVQPGSHRSTDWDMPTPPSGPQQTTISSRNYRSPDSRASKMYRAPCSAAAHPSCMLCSGEDNRRGVHSPWRFSRKKFLNGFGLDSIFWGRGKRDEFNFGHYRYFIWRPKWQLSVSLKITLPFKHLCMASKKLY